MGLLSGKVAVIFGLANKDSIAWGITQALHREGATIALSYARLDALKRRVEPLAESLGIDFVEQCDVASDEDLDQTFAKIKERYGKIDILIHSVAFANREDITGDFVPTSRSGFHVAMDISVYSLIAMVQRALPMMAEGGTILSMTFYGSQKVMPHYNVMGVAKAALEAATRYLAAELGTKNIRVNAVSAGAIKTLSGAGIANFREMLRFTKEVAPLKRLIEIEDVGNTAVWLCSDYGSAITGQVIYVDSGISTIGLTMDVLNMYKVQSPESNENAGG